MSLLCRPVFLCFGDSITQRGNAVGGWTARLADAYGRRVDVLNRGYSGYNTSKAVQLLPHVFPPGSCAPALVTVFFGANDAACETTCASHHVPVAEYEKLLRQIVHSIRGAFSGQPPSVLLITPPPVDEPARVRANAEKHGTSLDAPPERTCERTSDYAAACLSVAKELGCASVDAFSGFQAVPGWRETHFNDGLHFAPDGDAALFRLVAEAIDKQLPHLRVDRIPYDFPEWFDFVEGKLP
jgi:lysophospholipase L1-like esterase